MMGLLRFFVLVFGLMLLLASGMLTHAQRQSWDGLWKIVFTRQTDAEIPHWEFVEVLPTGRVIRYATPLQGDLIWSPDNESVLYTEFEGIYGRRLVLAKADGSQRQVLIEDAKDVVDPVWSLDGEWIVFADQISERHRDIFRMRRDGSARTAFGLYDYPYCCQYAADGETMWFYWHHDETGSVYQIRADGTNPRHIVTTSTDLRNTAVPFVTPGGEWIIFMANNANQHGSIFRVHADGTDLQAITLSGNHALLSPSPDGEWIAFATPTPLRYSSDLFRMKVDGGRLEQLTRDIPIQPYGNGGYNPDVIWSPDGQFITFFADCKLYEVAVESKAMDVLFEGCFTGRHHFLPIEGQGWSVGWGIFMGVVMVIGSVLANRMNGRSVLPSTTVRTKTLPPMMTL